MPVSTSSPRISGIRILLSVLGPWLITSVTDEPDAALEPPAGFWEMTFPASTVSEKSCVLVTSKPLFFSVAVASASTVPFTSGTGMPS